ncbi:MAG: hypothetical protein KC729_21450, partial [Candidatus Eisenbacteria bacterium]|nr:hypothetical protein [Candidatus Eisenbacteria bacterium]
EVYSSCDNFGIPAEDCTGVTNFTPLLDNVSIGFTRAPDAPLVSFSPASTTRYRDTFAADGTLSPTSTANCDATNNVNLGNTPPFVQGDSLLVTGPVSTLSTRWESRLWFRVARKGPAQDQIAGYATWRDRVSDGQDIENGSFAYAWMDSFQTYSNPGGTPARNKFVTYFREDDDDYDPGAGELKTGNEILPDGVFVPGSRLEYFVTANYIGNADNYLLPDTSGGNYFEIRFLPEYRDDGGVWKFPALLHIDAGFVGEKMDRMLNVALNGAAPSDPIPAYPAWDRYDNIGGACCWKIPFARDGDPRSTSGITARQLLGYRGVIFSGGGQPTPAWSIDWDLLCSWLSALHCEGEGSPRGLIFHGDRAGTGIISAGPYYLLPRLGVAPDFDSYRTVSGDDNYCVRIEDVAGSSYPPTAAVDAWGSGCPDLKGYEVLSPAASGVGSRAYENVGTGQVTEYQQITNDVNDPILGTYRTVVSSVSYDHLSVREQGDECTQTFDRIVEAGAAELSAALNWIFGGNVPGLHED